MNTTEVERALAYAEAQVTHPDPQLTSFVAAIYRMSLPQLQAVIAADRDKLEDRTQTAF